MMIRELYRHMEWADATVWSVVLATAECQGDERFRDKLYHIHMVQHAFVSVWSQMPGKAPAASSFANLQSLAAWGRNVHETIASFVEGVDEARLDLAVVLPWANRLTERFGSPPQPTTFRETLLQVPMHSQYHRGQVNTRLRELGGDPPLVDYIAWVWLGRPEAVW